MMKAMRFLTAAVPVILFSYGHGLAASEESSSAVVINEVYYDHPGSDLGHEFVELYCPGADPVTIDGWSLVHIDGLSGESRELWRGRPGAVIAGGGFLLIGCDSCGSGAGESLCGSLENGPDAVALLFGVEESDLVGYGTEGPALRSEGAPCPDCAAGLSLSRRPDGTDSNDNLSDFVETEPTPGRRNFHEFDLELDIADPPPIHCPFKSFEIVILLVNKGLEEFSGHVSLAVMCLQGGIEIAAGCSELDPRIGEGGSITESVGCAGLPGGRSKVVLRIDSDRDSNSSNDSVSIDIVSSPGSVVVNEIMYRDDGSGEWIELMNRSGAPVDLSGWKVSDLAGSCGSIGQGVAIGAGSYLILAQDPQAFMSYFSPCEGTLSALDGSWPRLNDGSAGEIAETVYIRSDCGLIVESVSYMGICGEERGRSIERISPDICSAEPAGIWLRCGAPGGGTPGCENHCDTGVIPGAGVRAFPDPFCPQRDGSIRFAAAAYPGEGSFRAAVYDIQGREIKRLPSGPVAAPAVSFVWDGIDGEGRSVDTGLYICVVEFFSVGGGVCRRERCPVAVWSRRHGR